VCVCVCVWVCVCDCGVEHVRLSKAPADEKLMLAPPGRAMWQGGSIAGGRRTPSTEGKQQARYSLRLCDSLLGFLCCFCLLHCSCEYVGWLS